MKQTIKLTLVLLLSFTFITCKAQKKGTEDKPNKYEMEGLKNYNIGEYRKAAEIFEAGLRKDPTNKSILNMLGSIYADLGEHENAIVHLKNMTKYHPDYTNGYYYLSQSQYKIGQYKEAKLSIDTFLMGKDLVPEFVEKVNKQYKSIDFALKAIDNPVDVTFENMGKSINTKYHEYWPGLTIDEEVFIFTRLDSRSEDIYLSRKSGDAWGNAFPLPGDVNTPMNEGNASVTADGKYIFYTSCNRREGYGSCDIFLSILMADGTFSKPRILRPPLNSGAWESQPSISADGMTIYFASNREGGYGGIDIWKSEWKDNNFGTPINLGPEINTPGDEQAPFIHADGKTLYFSSNGREETMGGADLFVTKLTENGWTTPQNLGYPINTFGEEFGIIVDRKGEFAYFSSDRPGGFGGRDIYKFNLPKNMAPEPVSFVKGKVFDKKTLKPLDATVELIDLKTGELIKTVNTDSIKGEFLIVLANNTNYMINIDRKEYLFYSSNFKLTDGSMNKPFVVEAPLSKPDSGSSIVLNNIFFDTDKYALKPESKTELKKLYEFMIRYPDMVIEIGGHTDNTGKKENNLKLSENRAKAVMEYLIEMGIKRTRLSAKGYADEEPIATNDTDEGKAKNRRTEIKIVSI